MKHALIFVGAGLLAVVVAVVWVIGIRPQFFPPAPPLLQHVTAAGGWSGACPPRSEQEASLRRMTREALSPELNRALEQQFPAGSPADVLVGALAEQGFKLGEACPGDPTIRRASFNGPTRGSILETNAEIYWKTENGNLVWTKGFVTFTGL